MGYKIDLTGMIFGKWTVLEYSEEYSKPKRPMWKCQCSCDKHTIKYISGNSLRSGTSKSCGCLKSEEDLTGKTFGRWKVLGVGEKNTQGKTRWLCECQCENKTRKNISTYYLIHNISESCGCLIKEKSDLTGQIFGRLTVLRFDQESFEESKKQGKKVYKWICECNCKDNNKNIVSVFRMNLIRGNTTSCGCIHSEVTHEVRFDDLTGQRFGKLIAIDFDKEKSTKKASYWNCKCDCGNITSIWSGNLKNGHTSSCGCLNSYIESACKLYFDNIKVDYISQHTYEDCKYKQQLRFDFYLPNYNCCIEFDGLHHFEPTTFGGRSIKRAEKDFKETQAKDEIKNKYCENNNIRLIRIPYWNFDNYKDILFKELGIGGETCL